LSLERTYLTFNFSLLESILESSVNEDRKTKLTNIYILMIAIEPKTQVPYVRITINSKTFQPDFNKVFFEFNKGKKNF
jgi:hypothetical protein